MLVIGGGIAGASAALAAAEQGASVLVLAKSGLTDTNTNQAQGGVAAVLGSDDSFELHLRDTLSVGAGLTNEKIAREIIRAAPEAIAWMQAHHARFDCNPSGQLRLSREGGHSVGRVAHANGDSTGREIQRALSAELTAQATIDVREGAFVRDLILDASGRCVGAILIVDGSDLAVEAGATVLATGGAGQVYRETTNPIGACGDGVAIAFRAGAEIRDMEFVQFHPTTLYIAGATRFLISEVVRGAGAQLRDRDGVRFMVEAHPDAELAPRDVVSRAILDRMVATKDTHVYLDLTNIDGDPHQLFPSISNICRSFDIDVARDLIPVRPGAHYFLGGVATGADGRSSIPGLFAVGEAAGTGFHGANRLASNSLLEGAVLGREAGRTSAADCRGAAALPRHTVALEPVANPPRLQLEDMLYSLKSLMWRQVGLQRTAAQLGEARERIGFWNTYLQRSGLRTRQACELANMLTVSALVAEAALLRTESRGTHFRTDYPNRDDAGWCQRLSLIRTTDGAIAITRRPTQDAP